MTMELFAVSEWDIMIRLTIAVALGLAVGAERSRVGKRAGMRTYALVSLGAALFIVIAGIVSFEYANTFIFDPLRVASQIVVGIGFLGAGMIFVNKDIVNGLTTAAGIWVTAAVGVACGYGLYVIATYVTFLTLVIFEVLWYVEAKFIRTARTEIEEDFIQSAMGKTNRPICGGGVG
ncbi:MAG: MgtC family protein [Parcubacteria group bacterium GW2011_GWA2_47_7]|nr:MAG: MgtC family protein [Parcubacteria group bacterium GW2011_GWA2_47_7]